MSFVQQEIQNIVQDGIIYYRTSNIPDCHQLKAGSAPNQYDNQKMSLEFQNGIIVKVKFAISHNYSVDVFKPLLYHIPKKCV